MYPALATTRLQFVVGGIAAAAWVLLLSALVGRWGFAIAWAVFAFGAEYAVFLRLRGGSVDSRALFVSGALVLVAELAFRTILPTQGRAEGRVALRSLVALGVSVLAAMIGAGVVLVAAGSVRSGIVFEALGVLGATLVLAVVVRVGARARRADSI